MLAQANRMLLGRLPQDSFVTAFLGILSADSLRYSNAGHLAPLLVRGETVRPLDSHGLLGVDPVDRYDEGVLARSNRAISCSRTPTGSSKRGEPARSTAAGA